MRVLGVDPSLAGGCGLALVAGAAGALELMAHGERKAPKSGDVAGRIAALAAELDRIVERFTDSRLEPLVIAYEAAWLRRGPHENAQSMRKLSLVGGAVIGIAAARRLRVIEVQPAEGKLALSGDSRADKQQQIAAALQQFRAVLSEHEADALGVALHAAAVVARTTALARK